MRLLAFLVCVMFASHAMAAAHIYVRDIHEPAPAQARPQDAGSPSAEMPSQQQTPVLPKEPATPVMTEAHLVVIDKRTARTKEYTVQEGRTFTHESLQIRVQECWIEPDVTITPEHAALVEIHEEGADNASTLVFSGWLFVNTSSISNLQHQAYEVMLKSCTPLKKSKKKDASKEILRSEGKEGTTKSP